MNILRELPGVLAVFFGGVFACGAIGWLFSGILFFFGFINIDGRLPLALLKLLVYGGVVFIFFTAIVGLMDRLNKLRNIKKSRPA